MIIDLDFHDLQKLAVNSEVVKNNVTIRIQRPVLSGLNSHAERGNEFMTFSLDNSDPRSKKFKWNANKC